MDLINLKLSLEVVVALVTYIIMFVISKYREHQLFGKMDPMERYFTKRIVRAVIISMNNHLGKSTGSKRTAFLTDLEKYIDTLLEKETK